MPRQWNDGWLKTASIAKIKKLYKGDIVAINEALERKKQLKK